MYKIDIKEALYPIQIVFVVYKKFSQTSVFIDRKWPITFTDRMVYSGMQIELSQCYSAYGFEENL